VHNNRFDEIIANENSRLQDIGYGGLPSCGNFFVMDASVLKSMYAVEGLEVLPISDAIEKYPRVRDELYFGLVQKDKNDHTHLASETKPVGYYIKVEPGVQIEDPVQAAFMLGSTGSTQVIHNIIDLGEGSGLNILNGCTTSCQVFKGKHIGITEIYLSKGADLSYTMLHNWGEDIEVYPVTGIRVDKDARFVSNYAAMTAVKKLVAYPTAWVEAGGSARFNSIIYSKNNSFFDMGASAVLNGEDSGAEIISRVVSEAGTVISRQMIEGRMPGCKGHMECSGLLLDEKAVIHTIPELKGSDPDINLSHEAAVGKISSKELSYLMARGLTEEEARSLIIRGFLDISIDGIPPRIHDIIEDTIKKSVKGSV